MAEYPVMLYVPAAEEITISEKEVCKYLGYGGYKAEGEQQEAISRGIRRARELMAPKAVYCRYSVGIDGDRLQMPYGEVHSETLAKVMNGCREMYIFAATIGAGFDRMLRRGTLGSMADNAILQACGAAAVEGVCDALNEKLRREAEAEGKKLRMRFSPGYGDLALENQRGIFRVLEPGRRIGLTLMDTLIMSPEKSVTAIIGIEG